MFAACSGYVTVRVRTPSGLFRNTQIDKCTMTQFIAILFAPQHWLSLSQKALPHRPVGIHSNTNIHSLNVLLLQILLSLRLYGILLIRTSVSLHG